MKSIECKDGGIMKNAVGEGLVAALEVNNFEIKEQYIKRIYNI